MSQRRVPQYLPMLAALRFVGGPLVAAALIGTTLSVSFGQIEVVDPTSRDLKRTAHKVRMTIEQLKNARAALQEATELARDMEPVPTHQISSLGGHWIRLHPTKAPREIESLLDHLRPLAKESRNEQDYSRYTAAAKRLLNDLVKVDENKAFDLAERWPASEAVENTVGIQSRLQEQIRARRLQDQMNVYPERISAMLPADLTAVGYGTRASLVESLILSGEKQQAYEIIDMSISEFSNGSPDQRQVQDYLSLLVRLHEIDPMRFNKGFAALRPYLDRHAHDDPIDHVTVIDQRIPINHAERTILIILQSMDRRLPETMLKVLNTMPSLKARLDTAGGIDSFLSPPRHARKRVSYSYEFTPNGSAGAHTSPESYARGSKLINELSGKATTNPSIARHVLSRSATEPTDIDTLIVIAKRTGWRDPDLATLALEVASDHLELITPLEKRAEKLKEVIRTYRWVNGEVDRELLTKGFLLAAEMRDTNNQELDSRATQKRSKTATGNLESYLIAEYARDDYNAAISYVHSMSEDNAKLSALLHIARSLGSSNHPF